MQRAQLKTMLIAVFCFTSLRTLNAQAGGSAPIKIGVVGPLTGRAKIYGEIHRRSIDLALKELNDKKPPGIAGRIIEPVFEDDGSDPQQSKDAVEKLAADHTVLAILGPVNSSCAWLDLEAAHRNHIPLIASLVTRTDLTREYDKVVQKSPGGPRYFFQTGVSDRLKASALVEFLELQMTPNSIASLKIFVERDSYGEGLRSDFDELLKTSAARPQIVYTPYSAGFSVADQTAKDREAANIREELRTFVVPHRKNWIGHFGLTTDFIEIAHIAEDLGLLSYIQFFSIEIPPPALLGRDLPEGTLFLSVFNPNDSRGELIGFKNAYTKTYPGKGEPRAAEIFAYSSMRLLARAMEESHPLTRRSLALRLQQMMSRGHQGEVADFNFDRFRDVAPVYELWVSKEKLVTSPPTSTETSRRFLVPLAVALLAIIGTAIYAKRRKVSAPVLALAMVLAVVSSGVLTLWWLHLLGGFFASSAFPIAGFLLAVLAIIFAPIQFWDARRHSSEIKRVAKSMSTRYVGLFPKNMDDIIEVVRLAHRELLIMCDVIDYGSYSRPETHQLLFEELKRACERRVSVQCLVYADKPAQETLLSQFKEEEFAETRNSPTYMHYFEYWPKVAPRDPKELTHGEFLEILRKKQQYFTRELLDKGVEIRMLSERVWLFFWLQDRQDAVLLFEDIGAEEQGLAFRTLDAKLVETFYGIFTRNSTGRPTLEKPRLPTEDQG